VNSDWKRLKLIDVIQKTETVNPLKKPDSSFEYIDVSSVCNKQFRVRETSTILGKDAPSRARKLVRTGDILFATVRPTLKRIAQIPRNLDEQICSTGYFVLRPKDFVEEKFLFYYLFTENFMGAMEQLQKGASYPAVNDGEVSSQTIFMPPLLEQKRIVVILDEAFERIDMAIANTEKNLTNARDLFESYLNSRLLGVVSGKATQTLLCITDLIIDCEHKTAPVQEEGIPSIRTPNIGKGYLIFDDVYRVSEETYKLWTRRGKPKSGDLILAREAPAGNVGVIPPGAKVCLGQRTVLIRPNKKIIDSCYLAFLLLHPIVQKRLLDKSTGATVQHVNMKDIRGLSMSELPSIQVQKECVEELEALKLKASRLESIYQQKIATLNELKQSILQKAFTGELTADTASQTIEAAEENRGISKDCLSSAEMVKQNVHQSG
jgi:type I restriction enzyme, S subunit